MIQNADSVVYSKGCTNGSSRERSLATVARVAASNPRTPGSFDEMRQRRGTRHPKVRARRQGAQARVAVVVNPAGLG